MRKQPTVHSAIGAFGNFTFPNWTQRVHIRDALSVPMATVKSSRVERATHFSPFRRGKTSAIRHAPRRGSVQHTRSPPRNSRAQQHEREMKPGSWQLSQEPWSLSVAPRDVPQLADGGTNLRHDRAQRADGTCTRVRLVTWRLLTGKPDAPRGGFNRSTRRHLQDRRR